MGSVATTTTTTTTTTLRWLGVLSNPIPIPIPIQQQHHLHRPCSLLQLRSQHQHQHHYSVNPVSHHQHPWPAAYASLSFPLSHPSLLWDHLQLLFLNHSLTFQRIHFFSPPLTNHVLESDKPSTVDLMEFLLSYAHLAIGNSQNVHSRIESSVRRLFHELAKTKGSYVESVSTAKESSATYEQMPRSLGRRVEMKKGDWICPRCNFMNFAMNSTCLECKDTRPKKLITGGEWECPQCNFFNFSRNVICLRCDCKKPVSNSFINPATSSSAEKILEQPWFTKIRQLEEESDMGNSLENEHIREKSSENRQQMELNARLETYPSRQMGSKDYEREQDEKSERWFKKVAELHDVKDLPSAISDEDFPEIMPMRKGENRFVVAKKKDRSLTSPMYKRKAGMEQAGNNNYVPFVPFPPDYFAKDKAVGSNESTNLSQQTGSVSSEENIASTIDFEASNNEDETQKYLESKLSLEGSAVKEGDPLDMSEEAKAERWFRRVAQIKDISELSEIPDEDFPSIMPMRKGVNRFVVSKRKTPLERRLTSSQYRRNLPIKNTEKDSE